MKLFKVCVWLAVLLNFVIFVVIETLSVVDTRLWHKFYVLASSCKLRFQRSEHE